MWELRESKTKPDYRHEHRGGSYYKEDSYEEGYDNGYEEGYRAAMKEAKRYYGERREDDKRY